MRNPMEFFNLKTHPTSTKIIEAPGREKIKKKKATNISYFFAYLCCCKRRSFYFFPKNIFPFFYLIISDVFLQFGFRSIKKKK